MRLQRNSRSFGWSAPAFPSIRSNIKGRRRALKLDAQHVAKIRPSHGRVTARDTASQDFLLPVVTATSRSPTRNYVMQNSSKRFKRSRNPRPPSYRACFVRFTGFDCNQILLPFRGTLLDSRGVEAIPRARLVVLEVMKIIQNEGGSLPSIKDSSLAIVRQKLSNAKGTALKPDRSVLLGELPGK